MKANARDAQLSCASPSSLACENRKELSARRPAHQNRITTGRLMKLTDIDIMATTGIGRWPDHRRSLLGRAAVILWSLAVTFSLMLGPVLADDQGPVGRWGSLDEKTHAIGSIVDITESNGTLQGKIVKLVQLPGQEASAMQTTCTQCTGDLKGKPINGLPIFWNLKRDGDEWTGGTILDNSSGNTYSLKMHLTDGGQKMILHAYLGIPLLGKDGTWVRMK